MKLYVWFNVRGYCMLNIQYVENSVFSAIVNFLNFCIIFFSMISINSLFLNIEFLEMRMGIIFFRGFIFFFGSIFFIIFIRFFFSSRGIRYRAVIMFQYCFRARFCCLIDLVCLSRFSEFGVCRFRLIIVDAYFTQYFCIR